MAETISAGTRLTGVVGWPVSHSRSPAMHNAAYAALAMDWAYLPLPVPSGRLELALRGLALAGFAGVNVTIPHKEGAAAACDELSEDARAAASVNTVVMREGRLRGETTDGAGMLDAIGPVPDGPAVVLGAGGAARAAVAALAAAGLEVAVAARDPEAAARLGRPAAAWPYTGGAALIVNATPVGQAGAADELPLDPAAVGPGTVVCDLAYRGDGAETGLVRLGRERGARAVDGLDVLVGQGARSFRIITGREPPVDVMARAARGPA